MLLSILIFILQSCLCGSGHWKEAGWRTVFACLFPACEAGIWLSDECGCLPDLVEKELLEGAAPLS